MIVLDAFAGDAIPIHLLTAEAFDLYRGRLAPGGTIAVHISNRHVDLAPVIRAQGLRLDLLSLLTISDPEPEQFRYTATWVVLSLNTDFITDPSVLGRAEPWDGGCRRTRRPLSVDGRPFEFAGRFAVANGTRQGPRDVSVGARRSRGVLTADPVPRGRFAGERPAFPPVGIASAMPTGRGKPYD